MERLRRGLEIALVRAWKASQVVVLEGSRAVGKTTLAKQIASPNLFRSLADENEMRVASESPRAWLDSLPFGTVIDEAQLIAGLSLVVKAKVDETGQQAGQFLLTGSARLARDELGGSDPLVGRARRFLLQPFAQCELADKPIDVVSELFDGDPKDWSVESANQSEMLHRIRIGGFPGVWDLSDAVDRKDWTHEYVTGLFSGEIRGITRDRNALSGLFRWLAAQSGQLVNVQKFGQANSHRAETVQSYLGELRAVFLLIDVPAWHQTPGRREIKTSRLFVNDPVFVATALELDNLKGPVLPEHGPAFETFVATEIQRLLGWSSTKAVLHHWRDGNGAEVDLVLEDSDSKRVVAIEVKAAPEPDKKFFKGIEAFKRAYPDRFHRGYVLHCGDHPLRHADGMWFLPFSALWSIGDSVQKNEMPSGSLALRVALANANQEINKSPSILATPEQDRLATQLRLDLDKVVQDLHLIADGIRSNGFIVEVDPAGSLPAATRLAIRDESQLGSLTARLNITDEVEPLPVVQWTLEACGRLLASGIIRWSLINRFGKVTADFGGEIGLPAGAESNPLSDQLLQFIKALPGLAERWPTVRREPPF